MKEILAEITSRLQELTREEAGKVLEYIRMLIRMRL